MASTAKTALFIVGIACVALLVGERAAAAPTIYVDPPETHVEIGDPFEICILINDELTGLTGYDLWIDYDETLIDLTGVSEGALPAGSSCETFLYWTDDSTPSEMVLINGAILGGWVDGPGEFLVLSFVALAGGTSPITFHDVDLRDIDNNSISAAHIGGEVITAPPTIYIDPHETNVNVGNFFDVSVSINDGLTELTGYDLWIDYDETLMDLDDVSEGTLPAGCGYETFFYWTDTGTPSEMVLINGAILGGSVDGSGQLAVLRFEALVEGISPVDFHDFELRDLENNPIPATAIDGIVVINEIVPVEERSWTDIKLMYR
jgi:hypothetical protein